MSVDELADRLSRLTSAGDDSSITEAEIRTFTGWLYKFLSDGATDLTTVGTALLQDVYDFLKTVSQYIASPTVLYSMKKLELRLGGNVDGVSNFFVADTFADTFEALAAVDDNNEFGPRKWNLIRLIDRQKAFDGDAIRLYSRFTMYDVFDDKTLKILEPLFFA